MAEREMAQLAINESEELSPQNAQQDINPWSVSGAVVDGKQVAIDYDKLIDQFGTRRVDEALLAKFERITGRKPHRFLRRGLFFSHRYAPTG